MRRVVFAIVVAMSCASQAEAAQIDSGDCEVLRDGMLAIINTIQRVSQFGGSAGPMLAQALETGDISPKFAAEFFPIFLAIDPERMNQVEQPQAMRAINTLKRLCGA